jgi:Ca-activated chloride channel homolog
MAGILIALARPQWGFAWEEAKQQGLDIIVAIDTSKSMLARDVAPTASKNPSWP